MQIRGLSKQVRTWVVLSAALLPPSPLLTVRLPKLEPNLTSPGSVLMIGERHRRSPSHRFFFGLVKSAVARGERVLVGLEIPSDRQRALDEVLHGERSPEGLAHPIIDCPSYRMLLEGLGDLVRGLGDNLSVKAIDAPVGAGPSRETAMAQALLPAVRGGGYDHVAILVGNLHALKEVPWAPSAAPAGPRLAGLLEQAGVPVTSLLQRFDGECANPAKGTFYGAEEDIVATQVLLLWGAMNTERPPPGLAGRAADGLVVWRCTD